MKNKEKVEAFYMGKLPTYEGCYIDDILAYKKMQFENNHHFIQWLFPIPAVSFYNLLAPTLSKMKRRNSVKTKNSE